MSVYVKQLKIRYLRGNRSTKSRILDEFCETTGYHRKHAMRVLTKMGIDWQSKPAGRKKKYDLKDLLGPLKNLWLATDQLCSKRLKVAIPLWLLHYEAVRYGSCVLPPLSLSPQDNQANFSLS